MPHGSDGSYSSEGGTSQVSSNRPSSSEAVVDVAGETLALLPERCAYWPREGVLNDADAHIGKAASYRTHGAAVQRGTTADNLARLDAAIARTRASRVAFVGDFLHAQRGRAPGTLDALAAWRARHPRLALVLVRGNHDARAGDPPTSLQFNAVAEPCALGPFALRHEPREVTGAYTLAGHVHPSYTVRGRANEQLRAPCFWFGPRWGILPAFGDFAGSAPIVRAPQDRVFVVADDRVIAA
jgi:DNA ligase-associated metallophosphoesterase